MHYIRLLDFRHGTPIVFFFYKPYRNGADNEKWQY